MMSLTIYFMLLSLYLMLNVMLTVAFLTLFERKVLASMQKRKGPNWTGFLGILQPLADALKLMLKENPVPQNASSVLFFGGPLILLMLSLSAWFVMPFNNEVVVADMNIGILYVFMVSSLNTLNMMVAGWSSNSSYAFLGALRSIAQVMAYEVVIGMIIMNIIVLSGSLNFLKMVWAQKDLWYAFVLWAQFFLFFMAMLAETNSHPFDLAEAESELVSGYNVEHSSVLFALFFLSEYANMILLCHVAAMLFLGGWTMPDLYFFIKFFSAELYANVDEFFYNLRYDFYYLTWIYHSFVYILKVYMYLFAFMWVSATLPSYSYDQLMSLGWKVFVPITMGLVFMSMSLTLFFDGFPSEGGYMNHFFSSDNFM